jgi:hypothetical protein
MRPVVRFFALLTSIGIISFAFAVSSNRFELLIPAGERLCGTRDLVAMEYAEYADEQTLEEFANEMAMDGGVYSEILALDATLIGRETYEVASTDSTTVAYRMLYGGGDEDSVIVRFMTLLDEQQVNLIEGASHELYHEVQLDAGEAFELRITLHGLKTGIHDLVIIGVPQTGHSGFSFSAEILGFTKRLTFVVRPLEAAVKEPAYQTLTKPEGYDADHPSPALMFAQDHSFQIWAYPEGIPDVNAGEALDFNFKLSFIRSSDPQDPYYPDASKSRFALLLFRNYQQIAIDDENLVFYGQIDAPLNYTELPVSLQIPEEAGVHDLLAVRIENPGYPMCVLSDLAEGSLIGGMVEAERVGINVLP